MGEPVGNGPRRDFVPGNSIGKREEQAAKAPQVEAPAPAEKIISSVVTTRKTPWWRRASRSIFAEDFSSIGQFTMTDLIIPTIRNTIREVVVGVVDKALWGSKAGVGRPGPTMGLRGNVSTMSTRYDQMTEGGRVISREARARHDFNEVVFPNREEAIIVLEGLIARIERFRIVTVADLYNLCGVTGDFSDQRWGWTDLNTASVRQRYGGWLLDLPEPEPIRN